MNKIILFKNLFWGNIEIYKEKRGNFLDSAGPQRSAKYATEIVDVFNCFLIEN
jgi:hypothetical protein